MKNIKERNISTKVKILIAAICAAALIAAVVTAVVLVNKNRSGGVPEESTVETGQKDVSYRPVDTADLSDNGAGTETADTGSAQDTDEPESTEDTQSVDTADTSESGTGVDTVDTSEPSGGKDEPRIDDLGHSLTLVSLESYSGRFVEDGTDDEVDNIVAATVRNDGDRPCQYIVFTVTTEDGIATFEASTIPAGASVLVLEKNRTPFTTAEFTAVDTETYIEFMEIPALHSDELKVSGADGQLIVANTGDGDITDNVTLYYKNVKDGKYFGGITYAASINGGIPAGQSVMVGANHFKIDSSRLMFINYVSGQ
ncbi:MAG: hypothetical protein IJT70_03885 [Clostridia bacterium]|nr:hypothetical protein [Clostridia bacterium]